MSQTRQTPQQTAIEQTIRQAARPLSPAEILELSRRRQPSLSLATVYRTLKRLEDDGLAARVDIPGQPPRYESAAAAEKHHHHFACRACGRVFDIPGCAKGVEALAPEGFNVDAHEIVLYGTCKSCMTPR